MNVKRILFYVIGGYATTFAVQFMGGSGTLAFVLGMIIPGVILLGHAAYRIKTQNQRTHAQFWTGKRHDTGYPGA